MKTYVLYHANCCDGFGAALAARIKLGDDALYIPVNYGQPVPAMDPGSTVFIVDFSYPAPTLLEIGNAHHSVTVLDHHATAEKDLSLDAFLPLIGLTREDLRTDNNPPEDGFDRVKNIQLKFDMTRSGAVLAWEFFHPGMNVPLFFLYLQDRDLWKFELPFSREVSAFIQTLPMDFIAWERVEREFSSAATRPAIFTAGTACLKLKEQAVEIMAKNCRMALFCLDGSPQIFFENEATLRTVVHGCLAPASNATIFFSEVGEKLLEMFPKAPFSSYYLDRSDGKRQWGLRSRPDFDCSVISKAFGGGGHKQASGFTQNL